jgi:hypothetical protein
MIDGDFHQLLDFKLKFLVDFFLIVLKSVEMDDMLTGLDDFFVKFI